MSWILVANRTGARIIDKQGRELSLVETISHEQGRLRDRDIDADRQGRAFDRMGEGRHAMSTSESAHEHDAKQFANRLADRMRQLRMERKYERLVLVAEPHFLGLLRQALDDVTARLVVASVSKDLGHVGVQEIDSHLPELPQKVL